MNQICKVCGEPAAGFHFGAFTCEGCKSFFGRSYNNVSSISECKNNGKCIIDKKNRTTCKACRLRKCYSVGMSKGGSRYGRRSNWFKIHCLLQEQQQQAVEAANKAAAAGSGAVGMPTPQVGAAGSNAGTFIDMATAAAAAQQQRNSHMAAAAAAQHMGGLLGYPSYLPGTAEMMSSAPFSSQNAAAAAAALPFFSMLPNIGSTQSAFQLPPHLLFPGYHPGAAAAVAAADAAYRNEMYRHRQSVDSAGSAESQSRYSPAAAAAAANATVATNANVDQRVPSANSMAPSNASYDHSNANLTAANEERRSAASYTHSPVSLSSSITQHQIHSPIAIRATPKMVSPTPSNLSVGSLHSEAHHAPTPASELQLQQQPAQLQQAEQPTTVATSASLTFAVKMQSLSPVSVCSISGETAPSVANSAQECPMDLSMKASRSSVYSFNTSAGESGVHSDASEEDATPTMSAARARKFHELMSSENESDVSLDADVDAGDSIKRQKLSGESGVSAVSAAESDSGAEAAAVQQSGAAPQSFNRFPHGGTSLCGIFVCV